MYTNATIKQLEQALRRVNKMYDGNISFNRLEQQSPKKVAFTLSAKTGEKGSRYAGNGRRLPKASWHVHGYFFDALFDIDPNIYVLAYGKKITKDHGNWQDIEIGGSKLMSETSIGEPPTKKIKMANKTKTLEWSVNTAALLKEIIECGGNSMGAVATPVNILKGMLAEVAERAIELNDPILNGLMCRLALYSVSDQYDKDFNQKIVDQVIVQYEKAKKERAKARADKNKKS